MPLVGYGEKLDGDGTLQSFLLTEELAGYAELQDFLRRRFAAPAGPGITVHSPEGAIVSSQGRQPLEQGPTIAASPGGATRDGGIRLLSPLQG